MRSAATIIEDRDGRILLLRRGPTAPWMPMRWNLPGGHVEPGETTMQAAAREALEETSLRVSTLQPVVRMRTSVTVLDVYYAEHWTGRLRIDKYENDDYAWVPRDLAWRWDLIPPQRDALRWFVERS